MHVRFDIVTRSTQATVVLAWPILVQALTKERGPLDTWAATHASPRSIAQHPARVRSRSRRFALVRSTDL
jgi:hypothetical protein